MPHNGMNLTAENEVRAEMLPKPGAILPRFSR